MTTTTTRKGARRMSEIPPEIRDAIDTGRLATVDLVEFLAADLNRLTLAVATQIGLDAAHPALLAAVDRLPTLKPMQRHGVIARALWHAGCCAQPALQGRLASHCSDLARQWAALQVGFDHLSLAERLQCIRPFAADPHFGVREFAWMAVRDAVAAELDLALELLAPWVKAEDPNLRRFASELTRPRGVWCVHLETLKLDPTPGLQLIESLRADPSRYVQNSVGNWLNDAAKSQPEIIISICARWQNEPPNRATDYICQRGLRTLAKGANNKLAARSTAA